MKKQHEKIRKTQNLGQRISWTNTIYPHIGILALVVFTTLIIVLVLPGRAGAFVSPVDTAVFGAASPTSFNILSAKLGSDVIVKKKKPRGEGKRLLDISRKFRSAFKSVAR